jgi:hypothetical protein
LRGSQQPHAVIAETGKAPGENQDGNVPAGQFRKECRYAVNWPSAKRYSIATFRPSA